MGHDVARGGMLRYVMYWREGCQGQGKEEEGQAYRLRSISKEESFRHEDNIWRTL